MWDSMASDVGGVLPPLIAIFVVVIVILFAAAFVSVINRPKDD